MGLGPILTQFVIESNYQVLFQERPHILKFGDGSDLSNEEVSQILDISANQGFKHSWKPGQSVLVRIYIDCFSRHITSRHITSSGVRGGGIGHCRATFGNYFMTLVVGCRNLKVS